MVTGEIVLIGNIYFVEVCVINGFGVGAAVCWAGLGWVGWLGWLGGRAMGAFRSGLVLLSVFLTCLRGTV